MEVKNFSEYADYRKLKWVMNLSLPNDFLDDIFLETLTLKDPNFEEENIIIAEEDGTWIGFVFGVERKIAPPDEVQKHKDIMWIKAFGVLNRYASTNILEKLLREFEDMAKEKGKKFIRVSDYASWYLTPGVDNLYDYYNYMLVNNGYNRVGAAVNYEIDMARFYIPNYIERLKKKSFSEYDIVFENVTDVDQSVLKWIKENFSSYWRTEAEIAMKNAFGGVVVAKRDGEILGFSTYGSLHPSWFGPVGVSKESRGMGIGTLLLYETLLELRTNGQRVVIIPWTKHLFYYAQLPGVSRIRYFNIYQKELER